MGSFPALGIRPPEQTDLLGRLGRLQQLRNMGQQGQLQQQQIQETQIGLEQKKRQMQDQQTIMQVASQYQGGLSNPAALQDLSGKISASSFIPLQKSLAETAKSYAELDEKQLANEKTRSDLLLGLIQQAKQIPPEQYAQAFPEIAQKAMQIEPKLQGHIDPSQPIPQQALDSLSLGFATHSQLASMEAEKRAQAEEARKAALAPSQLASSQAEAKLKEAQAAAGGTSPDMMAMQDWLKKNPGKGASDFIAWKAKQSPMGIVMGNQLGEAGPGSAIDQAAQRYAQTGELPSGFARSPGTLTAIMKRAAELNPSADIAGNKAVYNANKNALSQLQAQFSKVEAFSNTALKNMDQVLLVGKDIPDLGARFANVPVRSISAKMIGTKNMARFNAAMLTARTEAARVLNSATGAGVLTNEQKQEVNEIIAGNLPYPAMEAAINQLKTDMGNRTTSYQQEIANLTRLVGGQQQTQKPEKDPLGIF